MGCPAAGQAALCHPSPAATAPVPAAAAGEHQVSPRVPPRDTRDNRFAAALSGTPAG
jgi:hypothetical protein